MVKYSSIDREKGLTLTDPESGRLIGLLEANER